MIYWYDRTGKVIANADDDREKHMRDIAEVEKLLSDKDYKVLAQDFTPKKKYWISTVWLGLDHGFSAVASDKPNPNPVIFETMVFQKKFSMRERIAHVYKSLRTKVQKNYSYFGYDTTPFQDRYTSEEEAIASHQRVLEAFAVRERPVWSFVKYAAKRFWADFWHVSASWSRATGYLFAAAWIASFGTYFLDKNHQVMKLALDAALWISMLIYFTYNGIQMHRRTKELKEMSLEIKIRSIVLETMMMVDGDIKGSERLAELRKKHLK